MAAITTMDADSVANLEKRARCFLRYGRRYCRSNWYYYGRWVLTGIAILACLLFLLCCCFTARRRRRRGNQPYYGTGWMAPPPKYGNHGSDYQMNPQTGAGAGASAGTYPPPPQPPPAYGPQYGHGQPQPQYQYQYYGQPQQGQPQQYSGTMPASDQAYYGQQQQYHETGVQPPANTHQPGK